MKNKFSIRFAGRRGFCPAIVSTESRVGQRGFINLRALLGLTLGLSGVALAIFAGKDGALQRSPEPERYLPVPGGIHGTKLLTLANWNSIGRDRLTFPTGRFDPAWLRAAAAQHARMTTGVPTGKHLKLKLANPNALSTTNFTALGPQPERMTGCSGCFDYTTTEGRVNSIAVDPTTTVNGSIVAYAGALVVVSGRRVTAAALRLPGQL
jgi:hypothetical protein